MTDKTGGPAFPAREKGYTGDGGLHYSELHGMTLRDYFAAQALKGMLSDINTIIDAHKIDGDKIFLQVAKGAYLWADMMLKARDNEPRI